jgi:hypothetical protein
MKTYSPWKLPERLTQRACSISGDILPIIAKLERPETLWSTPRFMPKLTKSASSTQLDRNCPAFIPLFRGTASEVPRAFA